MLVIRREQLDAIRRARIEAFHGSLVSRLRTELPEHAERRGPETTAAAAACAIEQAERLGLETFADVWRYAYLVLVLGPGFLVEPPYPWVARVLSTSIIDAPLDRLRLLHEEARMFVALRGVEG
jgi:hypothetical protein